MANKLKGEVEVGIGDRKLIIRLGLNELINLQQALGYEDEAVFLKEFPTPALNGMKKVRIAVHQALLARQPEMTETDAGDIVTELGFNKCGDLLAEAMRWSMPEREGAGKARGKAAGASAGATS